MELYENYIGEKYAGKKFSDVISEVMSIIQK